MLSISKEESMYIREKSPSRPIVVLNRQAPARKRSYCVQEDATTLRLLDEYNKDHRRVVYSSDSSEKATKRN